MSRMLAAKAALAIRVDALGEDTNVELGMEHRAMLEKRMKALEDGKVGIEGEPEGLLSVLLFWKYFWYSVKHFRKNAL